MTSVQKRVQAGRVSWLARWRDESGRQVKKSFPRKVDAERHLVAVQSSLASGSYVDPQRSRVTVGEFAADWMQSRAHLKPKTEESYRSLLRTQILPVWADVPLTRVTHSAVSAWLARMVADGLSASIRASQAYHLLHAVLQAAVMDNRLARNPATGVRLPRLPRSSRRYLTTSQVRELAAAAGEPDGLLIILLAVTGLRWGEAAALRVRHLDLGRKRIQVVEALVDVGGRLSVGPPKSHQSRSVAVPAFLCDQLAGHVLGRAPDDLVFTSPRGTALRVQNFRRRSFDAAAAAVGLEGLVPHELQHTAASLAIASGASITVVQSMLGHASATLTLDRYGHLFPDELDAVSRRLDDAWRDPGVP